MENENRNPSSEWLLALLCKVSCDYFSKPYPSKDLQRCFHETTGVFYCVFIKVEEENWNWVKDYLAKGWISNCDFLHDVSKKTLSLKVNRPNHSLIHAARVVYYAMDIVDALCSKEADCITTAEFTLLRNWVREKCASIVSFKQQVAVLASLVKSGRQSEISERGKLTCEKCYNDYKRKDAEHFISVVKTLYSDSTLFSSKDIQNYRHALKPRQDMKKLVDDTTFMRKLLEGAHNCDLRRLYPAPHLISEGLIGRESKFEELNDGEKGFVVKLWERAAIYIGYSGEKYVKYEKDYQMVWDNEKRNKYCSNFAIFSYKPELLVPRLDAAREFSNKKYGFR
jgi:hypothetical protein